MCAGFWKAINQIVRVLSSEILDTWQICRMLGIKGQYSKANTRRDYRIHNTCTNLPLYLLRPAPSNCGHLFAQVQHNLRNTCTYLPLYLLKPAPSNCGQPFAQVQHNPKKPLLIPWLWDNNYQSLCHFVYRPHIIEQHVEMQRRINNIETIRRLKMWTTYPSNTQ